MAKFLGDRRRAGEGASSANTSGYRASHTRSQQSERWILKSSGNECQRVEEETETRIQGNTWTRSLASDGVEKGSRPDIA